MAWSGLFLVRLFLCGLLLLNLPLTHADESLTYDANGNIQSRTLPGGTTQYGYDDLDRLTSETGPAKTQSITYDANDNRLSDGSGNKTYTANSNQLATANGQTVTRDKAGNITLIRGLTLEWNQAGRLKTVKQGSTQLAAYFYDYKGRRSRKVTPTETTIYIYDLWDHLMVEFDGQGNPLRTYAWVDDNPVAIIVHGTPERVIYLETDHLNTPIAARDEQAKLIWKWESDAFGSTLPNEDPDKDGVKTTVNLRFPGQFYDKESGFHYNHHRYYDPQTGRYLSPDPIGLAGGRNSYGYVGGNPTGRTDPTGLMAGVDDVVLLGGALIVGAAMSTPQGQNAIGGAISGAINAVKEACPCINYTNVYEANDGKHGSGARSGPRGTISPEPINGSVALATSVPVGNARLGHDPSTGQLIVFRNHRTDEQNCIKYWHGYVVGQKDLTPDQWRAGRSAGFPDWPRKPQ